MEMEEEKRIFLTKKKWRKKINYAQFQKNSVLFSSFEKVERLLRFKTSLAWIGMEIE